MARSTLAMRAQRARVADQGEAQLSKARFLGPAGGLTLLLIFDCSYVLAFGFSKGLDSTSSEFARFWYPVLAFNVLVLMPGISAVILGLWKRPCRTCTAQRAAGGVNPEHELHHMWVFMGIVLASSLGALGQFAIAIGGDAAWHQSSLRDTTITPIHILGFYGFAPLGFLGIIMSFVYARTRMPALFGAHRGTPLAYALLAGGGLFGLVNFTFNEFGHSMWIYEELFTYPMHYPFVLFLGTQMAIFALFVPVLMRVSQIIDGREPEPAESAYTEGLARAKA